MALCKIALLTGKLLRVEALLAIETYSYNNICT